VKICFVCVRGPFLLYYSHRGVFFGVFYSWLLYTRGLDRNFGILIHFRLDFWWICVCVDTLLALFLYSFVGVIFVVFARLFFCHLSVKNRYIIHISLCFSVCFIHYARIWVFGQKFWYIYSHRGLVLLHTFWCVGVCICWCGIKLSLKKSAKKVVEKFSMVLWSCLACVWVVSCTGVLLSWFVVV